MSKNSEFITYIYQYQFRGRRT